MHPSSLCLLLGWEQSHMENIAIFSHDLYTFKEEISDEFKINAFGVANLMLGIKVIHSSGYIALDQHHFSKTLLELYGMINCKSFSTPLEPAKKGELLKHKQLGVNYHREIGILNYLC
ncbi:hypothetical protein O181_095197 [Austropuccinia psidii MF-1]|uniref:Reverse transcriptase Ty1/copia-type domain-containing protein n=1 Tax=Austropuccinia psidii MF-1 TaxID=1389203 RepID=A0A9Q3J4W2_9BASI|nr:hypothetical protein [Austropuccinia psidii MF-1]